MRRRSNSTTLYNCYESRYTLSHPYSSSYYAYYYDLNMSCHLLEATQHFKILSIAMMSYEKELAFAGASTERQMPPNMPGHRP